MEMRLSLLAVLEKRAAAPGAPSNTACGAGGVSAGRTWEIPAALQAGGAFGYSFQCVQALLLYVYPGPGLL